LIDVLTEASDLLLKKFKITNVDPQLIRDRLVWAIQKGNEHGFALKGILIGRYKQYALGASRQTGTELLLFPDPSKANVWHLRKFSVKSWGAGMKAQFNAGLSIGLVFDWQTPEHYQSRFCQADMGAMSVVGVGAAFKFTCSEEDLREIRSGLFSRESDLFSKSTTPSGEKVNRIKVILMNLGVGAGGGVSVSSPVHRLLGKDRALDFTGLGFVKDVLFQVLAEELELDDQEGG
jgi:hypothetical protein